MTERVLHLVRLVLKRRELLRSAAEQRVPAVDEGYVLHAGLARLFAVSRAPSQVPLHTFAIDDTLALAAQSTEHIFLLGYSDLDEAGLRNAMNVDQRYLVASCASRPMPRLSAGTRAVFRTRICPVIRTKQAGGRELKIDRRGRRISREVDVWLARRFSTWQQEPPGRDLTSTVRVSQELEERRIVYAEWLARELAREGAAEMEGESAMAVFRRARLSRRGAPRTMERPDVVMQGILRVQSEAGFYTLLRRGLGRHRAFGFGALLLRPA